MTGRYHLRTMVLSRGDRDLFGRLERMRSVPADVVAFGTMEQLIETVREAKRRNVPRRDSRFFFLEKKAKTLVFHFAAICRSLCTYTFMLSPKLETPLQK